MSDLPYDHIHIPEPRLQERACELLSLSKIPHGEERTAQIEHELGAIVFELWARKREDNHILEQLDTIEY